MTLDTSRTLRDAFYMLGATITSIGQVEQGAILNQAKTIANLLALNDNPELDGARAMLNLVLVRKDWTNDELREYLTHVRCLLRRCRSQARPIPMADAWRDAQADPPPTNERILAYLEWDDHTTEAQQITFITVLRVGKKRMATLDSGERFFLTEPDRIRLTHWQPLSKPKR